MPERLAEPLLQRCLQLLVNRLPHLVQLAIVVRLYRCELSFHAVADSVEFLACGL
jgi:hypothetical protein